MFALEIYARGADAWKLFQSPYNAAGSEVAQDPVGAQHYLRLSPRRRHASAAHWPMAGMRRRARITAYPRIAPGMLLERKATWNHQSV